MGHRNVPWNKCGGSSAQYPQMTIYDSMFVNDVSFALYLNSSCGIDGHKPCSGAFSGTPSIHTPDVAMAGVSRHAERFYRNRFFTRLLRTARCSRSRGSCPRARRAITRVTTYDMAKGERFVKDIYYTRRCALVRSGTRRCSSSCMTTVCV